MQNKPCWYVLGKKRRWGRAVPPPLNHTSAGTSLPSNSHSPCGHWLWELLSSGCCTTMPNAYLDCSFVFLSLRYFEYLQYVSGIFTWTAVLFSGKVAHTSQSWEPGFNPRHDGLPLRVWAPHITLSTKQITNLSLVGCWAGNSENPISYPILVASYCELLTPILNQDKNKPHY